MNRAKVAGLSWRLPNELNDNFLEKRLFSLTDGYQYSWFGHSYRDLGAHLDVAMRDEDRAGEKLFVEYMGQTVAIVDRETGEIHKAQIFVAVLVASAM